MSKTGWTQNSQLKTQRARAQTDLYMLEYQGRQPRPVATPHVLRSAARLTLLNMKEVKEVKLNTEI
jgi:hypothetical protein